MLSQSLLFVGIRGRVVALDRETGDEMWRVQFGSDYLTVFWDGDALFAATAGEIWRLDPETGGLVWHNKMRGLGQGLVSLATTHGAGSNDAAIEYHRRAAAAAAAAGAG
jgi:outer membrane protein assembly factor BamB